jgi:hypothetical protein
MREASVNDTHALDRLAGLALRGSAADVVPALESRL